MIIRYFKRDKVFLTVGIGVLLMVLAGFPGSAAADPLKAKLTGFEEVPAISTTGAGAFKAKINEDAGIISLDYELTYEGLEGEEVLFAHIHLGQKGVNGGISAFLCGGGDKPDCPPPSGGEVTGTIDASDIVGPAGQGIGAGEIDELVRAMKAGVTYANVHTITYPSGEIRGQIKK